MSSFTYSQTTTFTLTHAKYLASKVVADLKRIQRFYYSPSDSDIASYEAELIEYLKNGYLFEVTYGFQRDGKWIEPTLIYTASDLVSNTDDDPGRIRPGASVVGAHFTSFLVKNTVYSNLSDGEKSKFLNTLPFQRKGASTPGINGYLSSDKSYTSGGKSLDRSLVKNY